MPGHLLTAGSSILCAHGGTAQATAPNPRVKIMGQPVVTQAAPHAIGGCPYVEAAAPKPCATAQWASGATRVKVMGQPVLLQDSQATCPPNGTPATVVSTQARVKGI